MHIGRAVFSLLLLLVVFVLQGCGTGSYDERFEQRGNELQATSDQYED